MRTDRLRLIAVALATSALGGCATDGQSAFGADNSWGEANRQTFAAQVIDPAPQYDYAVPETSGDHAAKAIERYRTDKVKTPERIKTSNVGSGGSSGR